MEKSVAIVDLSFEFKIHDGDALYEAAKVALADLRAEAVAEYGENSQQLYAQPMEQLIAEQLHDPDNGEVHLGSCIMIILDRATFGVPGTELTQTTASSVRRAGLADGAEG